MMINERVVKMLSYEGIIYQCAKSWRRSGTSRTLIPGASVPAATSDLSSMIIAASQVIDKCFAVLAGISAKRPHAHYHRQSLM